MTRILFKVFDSCIFNSKRPAVLCRQKENTASCHRMWYHGGMLRLAIDITLSWILTKNLALHCIYLVVFVAPIFCPAGNTSGHYVVMRFNFGPSDATLPENHDIDSLRWNPL